MSTQRLRAFLLPSEMNTLLYTMIWANHSRVYKEEGALSDVTFDVVRLSALDVFWISPRELSSAELASFPKCAPLVGMVQVLFFPSDAAGALTLTTLASRSDTTSASGEVLRDLHNHATLAQIKRFVLPYLCRPVIARVGTAQRPYRDIGYTEGVARWWLDGGKLRNPLAKAQEFILPQGAALPPLFPVPMERTLVDTDARVGGA